MADAVKWNTEELRELSQTLKNNNIILEEKREFLQNLNGRIEAAWQGYAGKTFDERMDIDIQNTEILIKGINELINDLNSVIENCYEECENDVRREISLLKNKVF